MRERGLTSSRTHPSHRFNLDGVGTLKGKRGRGGASRMGHSLPPGRGRTLPLMKNLWRCSCIGAQVMQKSPLPAAYQSPTHSTPSPL